MRWKIKRIAFYCGTFLAVFIIYYKFSSMKQRSRISSNEKQYKMACNYNNFEILLVMNVTNY